MKRIVLAIALLCTGVTAWCSDTTRPWAFWYWMYGAVSKAGIKADLQAMKDVGLGGCYLMPIHGTDKAPASLPPLEEAPAQQLTPQFWEMIDYAMQQADSLGLQLGIHVCDGFALAGGPWISPAESMQKVVWTDTIVSIPRSPSKERQNVPLPSPAKGHDGYYEDIAVFAVPVVGEDLPAPVVSGSILRDENGTFRSKEPGFILFDYGSPVTVRSVEIVPSGNNVQSQRFVVEASSDGQQFTKVRALAPPRQGWQNTDQDYTYALPETTARYLRFSWTPEGTEPGNEDLDAAKWSPVLKVKDIRLSAEPRIDQYESKNGSVWRIPSPAPARSESELGLNPIRLIEKDGMAALPFPMEGKLRILRFGHTSTGYTNVTGSGGRGLECDKFSAAAVNKQIDGWFARFMQRPHHDVVKYMHVDSWECGSQNWSRTFAEEFRKRRGYDLLPFMPVYAGVPMDSAEQVLRDIRLTIDDLINEVFFQTVRERADAYGVQLSAESVAPTMMSDGMTHYKYVDQPMGEFWFNSPTHDKPNDMLDAISGAHVYGKDIVQAEGFTEIRGVWDETPADLKPLLDRFFALGLNRLFFHVFAHNPWTDRRPGMTLDGIGLFFQRDQTWFPEAKAFVDYVTRCQHYLQQGRPVVDITVYTGEEMPRRALTPDRLVNMLPGLFGADRVASEQRRLANEGCPMEESPVGVRHNAGIFDLKDWVNPLHGYHYDSMNPDGLTRWLAEMREPANLSMPYYRALVVPQGVPVSAKAREQIDSLRLYGITVLTEPYIADTLPGLPPDAVLPEGIAFTHRKTNTSHFYFLCNQTDSTRTFRAKFRLTRDVNALLDPLTGHLQAFRQQREGDYCCVDLTLPSYGSVIVMSGVRFYDVWPVSQVLGDTRPLGKKLRWDVTFCDNGERLTTDQLFDWSQSSNERIRYYSGRARYATTFSMKQKELKGCTWWLQLPGLHDVAHVWLNGHDMGIVWTAPYAVMLGSQLRPGKNTLEIEVLNTWHNALLGADQGKPPYDGIWTNARFRRKEATPLPAGLTEPPVLRKEQHGWFRTLFDE